jgi:hypothetical protein
MLKTVQSLLDQLGIALPAWVLLVAPLAAAALAVLGVKVVAWRKARAATAPAQSGPAEAERQLGPSQLRSAWLRFVRQLPSTYQRSILGFQHFIVIGEAGAGKTRVIDTYTDWRRHAKQFVESQTLDPDLPVYMASSSVVIELPARVLSDHSERCGRALTRLLRPLYRKRAPTVVAVADVTALVSAPEADTLDLAENIRAKVNILSGVRGAPVELRVALSRLDAIEGFSEFALFCREERVPAHIPLRIGVDAPSPASQVEAWIESARNYLPHALKRMTAAEYRKIVRFLAYAPALATPLGRFVGRMTTPDALSAVPVFTGVHLTHDVAPEPNPLFSEAQEVSGPDPRRPHLMAAAAIALVCCGFLIHAYVRQYAMWAPASAAIQSYRPGGYGTEMERSAREDIMGFTLHRPPWYASRPAFFSAARSSMRERFTGQVRNDLLVPRLKLVADRGAPTDSGPRLAARRSLYFLGLMHSAQRDELRILDPSRLEIWTSMTGLGADIIADYLRTADKAWQAPVAFDLAERELDERDTAAYWATFLRKIDEHIASGVVRPAELAALQSRAIDLGAALDRFDHDDTTVHILDQLDAAAGVGAFGSGPGARPSLVAAYRPKYGDLLANIRAADVLGQRERLREVLKMVRGTSIEGAESKLLQVLLDRLALLYAPSPVGSQSQNIALKIGQEEFSFDTAKWAGLVRESRATEQIVRFMRATSDGSVSIFYTNEMDKELRPLGWNQSNDGSVLFTGRASIEGRYTKTAYEKHVRDVVLKLTQVLEQAKVPDDQKRELQEHVREQVRRYASEYRGQLLRFYFAFGLRARSQEALRVALAQMVSDGSLFDEFLNNVAETSSIEPASPLLDPMKDAVSDFANLRKVVDKASGATELAKYKAILSQLLADLTAGSSEEAVPESAAAETLEKALTPTGRLVLANLRGDKGAYSAIVTQWLSSVNLPPEQRQPFLAPISELAAIGRSDIEQVVRRVWQQDVVPEIQAVTRRFPFDPAATDDVTPTELTELFHPQTGRFFALFRRYFEPLSEIGNGPFRELRTVRSSVTMPSELYPTVNAVAALAARLWDVAGNPTPLELQIGTVPFDHGINPRSALTLVFFKTGDEALFNFNQKPLLKTILFDWTKDSTTQIGVQLTDLETKENSFPEPAVVDGAYWSVFRLFRRAAIAPVKQPRDTALYSWEIAHGRGSNEKTAARVTVTGDPWEVFSRLQSRAPSGKVASR